MGRTPAHRSMGHTMDHCKSAQSSYVDGACPNLVVQDTSRTRCRAAEVDTQQAFSGYLRSSYTSYALHDSGQQLRYLARAQRMPFGETRKHHSLAPRLVAPACLLGGILICCNQSARACVASCTLLCGPLCFRAPPKPLLNIYTGNKQGPGGRSVDGSHTGVNL